MLIHVSNKNKSRPSGGRCAGGRFDGRLHTRSSWPRKIWGQTKFCDKVGLRCVDRTLKCFAGDFIGQSFALFVIEENAAERS